MKKIIFITFLCITLSNGLFAQNVDNAGNNLIKNQYSKHSIDFCPVSPLINIYGIHYNYHLTQKDELITGVGYIRLLINSIFFRI